ncbi:hypothetical protein PUN28_013063 [Cardiocondyla obscurior]|uniref:Uncharacterized protein n=1 Tax=Cardiocondyla obscurior TaxID=286306 RepID=A0AAW2F9T2_9HYME
MDTSKDIFQSRLYRLNRKLLSLLGQWPFQKDRDRRVILATISFIGLTQAVAQILALVTLSGDFDATIECIPPLLVDFVCVIKLTNLVCNIEQIKLILIHIQRDWQTWAIQSEFEILCRFAESGRSITIGYASKKQGSKAFDNFIYVCNTSLKIFESRWHVCVRQPLPVSRDNPEINRQEHNFRVFDAAGGISISRGVLRRSRKILLPRADSQLLVHCYSSHDHSRVRYVRGCSGSTLLRIVLSRQVLND